MRGLKAISAGLVCLVNGVVLGEPPRLDVATKQVAAPPSDIVSGVVRLPEPEDLGVVSRSALIPVDLPAGGVWERDLPPGARAVLLPGRDGAWTAALVSPAGEPRTLDRADEHRGVAVGSGSSGWIAPDRTFASLALPVGRPGLEDGDWTLRVESPAPARGFVLIEPGSGIEMYTYAERLEALVGAPIVLRSELSRNAAIVELWADVRGPDGRTDRVPAERGVIRFTPIQAGEHAVRVHAIGLDETGERIELTTQHILHAERPSSPFDRASHSVDGRLIDISLGEDRAERRSVVAAEVWGERDGRMVPVCWLARVCAAARSLTLDARWISMAGVDPGSIELRAVRAHDADSMTLVAWRERLEIDGDLEGLVLPQAPDAATRGMIHGVAGRSRLGVPIDVPPARGTPPGHRLLLVHGYCSGGNPFTTSHFDGDIAVFSDTQQNRSNDAFALRILSQTAPMKSFGVAGHSQGGLAALHLYTFYFSGMDWARGERLIQSVGSPYQGTPLAGNAAVLGDLFGAGCGSNSDLSTSGAVQWLSLIPTSSRQNVWYWTTSFEDRPFAFDFCNIVSDLLLSDPDDGVIERSRGQLPGGNNRGHREGWCHTTGMRDPAQCTDPSRNSEIDERARR